MLFGRRKPGYTTTVDAASDPEQVILDLQKAEMARRLKETAVCSTAALQSSARTSLPPCRRRRMLWPQSRPRHSPLPKTTAATGRRRKAPAAGFLAAAPEAEATPTPTSHRHRTGAAQADPGTGAGGLHPLPLGGGAALQLVFDRPQLLGHKIQFGREDQIFPLPPASQSTPAMISSK